MVLAKVFGRSGLLVAPTLTGTQLISFFTTQINAFTDIVTRRDTYRIDVLGGDGVDESMTLATLAPVPGGPSDRPTSA